MTCGFLPLLLLLRFAALPLVVVVPLVLTVMLSRRSGEAVRPERERERERERRRWRGVSTMPGARSGFLPVGSVSEGASLGK